MIITLEFSETQQQFHNTYPDEKFPPEKDQWIELGQIESEQASIFVWHMTKSFRSNKIHITEEFARVKWDSFLSKKDSITSK